MSRERSWGTASHLLNLLNSDARARGRGVHLDDVEGVHGTGAVPIGWEDCAWDYEQSKGYYAVVFHSLTEYTDRWWSESDLEFERWPFPDLSWSYDEVGLYPHDFTDETEEEVTGVMPMRHIDRRGFYDWEPPPPPLPSQEKSESIKKARKDRLSDDPHAEAWEDDLKRAEKEARLKADEEAALERVRAQRVPTDTKYPSLWEAEREAKREREAIVEAARTAREEEKRRVAEAKEDRRRLSRMYHFVEEQIVDHVRSGVEGDFEIEAREEGRTVRWSYTIKSGRAYVTKKRQGWLPLEERPPV